MHKVMLVDVPQCCQKAENKVMQLCCVIDADNGTHWLQSESHVAAYAVAKRSPFFWHGVLQVLLHTIYLQQIMHNEMQSQAVAWSMSRVVHKTLKQQNCSAMAPLKHNNKQLT